MKAKILVLALLVVANLSAGTHQSAGDLVSIEPFEQLIVVGDGQTSVSLCQSDKYAISVTEGHLSDLKIEPAGSMLMLFCNVGGKPENAHVTIYAPEWNAVLCSIVKTLQTTNTIKAKRLQIDANIAQSVDMNIESEQFEIKTTDVEKCVLGGTCDRAVIDYVGTTNGLAELHSEKLRTRFLHLKSVIESKAFVYASDSLWLQDCYTSDITVYGSPEDVKNESGSSTIRLVP